MLLLLSEAEPELIFGEVGDHVHYPFISEEGDVFRVLLDQHHEVQQIRFAELSGAIKDLLGAFREVGSEEQIKSIRVLVFAVSTGAKHSAVGKEIDGVLFWSN